MGNLQSPTPQQIELESWIWYSIGFLLVVLRLYSRTLVVGSVRNLQVDDYLIVFDVCMYTILMASINVSSRWATNLYEPWEFATFTAQDIRDRIYGSKIVILLEQSMLICTWTTKCCMLLMYNRLAARLWHEQAIRVISVYVVLGFFACELAWFLSCRLFWGYWALPVPDPQCATYQHYSITQATFNISSDILMLCVGLMLVSKARLPPAKKVLLVAVFSCGLFVVLAAILNKYYNFSNPDTTIYMLWYIRESSVALYVTNLPLLWPMFRRFLKAGSFMGPSSGGRDYGNTGGRYKGSKSHASHASRPRPSPHAPDHELDTFDSPKVKGHTFTTVVSHAGSEDMIWNDPAVPAASAAAAPDGGQDAASKDGGAAGSDDGGIQVRVETRLSF